MRLQVRLEPLLLLLLLLLFVLQEERSGGPLLLRGGQEQGRLDVLLHDAPHGGPRWPDRLSPAPRGGRP